MQYTLKKKILHFITPFNSILAVLAVRKQATQCLHA